MKIHYRPRWTPHIMNGSVNSDGRVWESYSWTMNEDSGRRYIVSRNEDRKRNELWRLEFVKSDAYRPIIIKYAATKEQAIEGINLPIDEDNIQKLNLKTENRIVSKFHKTKENNVSI